MCAFYTIRVYESYNVYMEDIIDEILRSEEFDDYYMQQMRDKNRLKDDFNTIIAWLDTPLNEDKALNELNAL